MLEKPRKGGKAWGSLAFVLLQRHPRLILPHGHQASAQPLLLTPEPPVGKEKSEKTQPTKWLTALPFAQAGWACPQNQQGSPGHWWGNRSRDSARLEQPWLPPSSPSSTALPPHLPSSLLSL